VGRYVIRRLLQVIPVFFGATFLIFSLVFALPGDPIRALAGERPLNESAYNVMVERYNLDDPFFVQYGKYIAGVFQGDFGQSFSGREVSTIMSERFPISARLALLALAIQAVLGVLAGVMAGIRKNSFMDNLVLVSTTAVVSIPVFVLGFSLQLLLGVRFGIFPVAGVRDGFISYILPAFVLASLSLAYTARLTRTSLVENLRADYVRTATAKGLPRRLVVGKHALRNSLIPVVTYLGISLGELIAGAIVTEGVFNIPGVGRAVFDAILTQEGPIVVGIVTALVLVYIVANLIVDLLYAVLDPRIRYA
jgi:oligopeptide transport system permease protein